jgi:hypothetical protein
MLNALAADDQRRRIRATHQTADHGARCLFPKTVRRAVAVADEQIFGAGLLCSTKGIECVDAYLFHPGVETPTVILSGAMEVEFSQARQRPEPGPRSAFLFPSHDAPRISKSPLVTSPQEPLA